VLVAGQIALTLVLLTAAGTAIEGFLRMMHVPLGFDPHNVLHLSVPPGHDSFASWKEQVNYLEQLREKIEQVPEVVSAGIATTAIPPHNNWSRAIELLGKPSSTEKHAALNVISPEYFNALHTPLLEGRLWNHSEVMRGSTLAVVNQTFTRRYFPNDRALGRSVRLPDLKNNPPYMLAAPGSDDWLQIIGVVADARNDSLVKPVQPAIYVPYSLGAWTGTQMVVRTRVDPLSILHQIQQELASVNPDQPIATIWTHSLEEDIEREPEWARGRFVSVLFGAFSVLALALAAVGLYSVVSYSVAQRTSEFGIRLALGAQKSDVLRIVLISAGARVSAGLAAGLALSFSLNRFVTRWIENGAHNPWMIVSASLTILAVTLLASLIPAHRTAGIDPTMALRCE
jgi:predicted permease